MPILPSPNPKGGRRFAFPLRALFERDRELIRPEDLHELRFEDLETSQRECLQKLYQERGLPDFERFWQQASMYLESIADYHKNTYTVSAKVRTKVSERWGGFFERCGYPLQPPLSPGALIPGG